LYTLAVSFEKDADTMTEDMMIRVPRELKNRFENLEKKNSWKGFASFVREAIRFHLDHHEEIERDNGS
jgi:predicted DNA-binding protein